MINSLIKFAIRQRVLVLIATAILLIWGTVSFTQLPIEAYPDVMNTQVQVITQWPGHAAEEVEKIVTVPLETSLYSVPNVSSLRSRSLFGLSVVYLTFDDGIDDYFARAQVSQAITGATLPPGIQPAMSPMSSATGEIMRYIVVGAPLTQLKTIEDWTLEREFKSVPGVADVSSFGGTTKEYQVQLDPRKLLNYNVTVKQVENAIAGANANGGGNFVERGSEEFVIRGIGMLRGDSDISHVIVAERDGTPVLVRDVATVRVGYLARLGKVGYRVGNGGADVDDAVMATILLRRGESPDAVLEGVHKKINDLNNGILPRGVKVIPIIDRTDLVHTTSHTVEHNLIEGVLLVVAVLFLFLGNVRAALIVALTIPFGLLFAFSCMGFLHIPANLLSLGAIDFGVIVNGSVILVENIYRYLARRNPEESALSAILAATREVEAEIVFTTLIIILAYLPLFTMQSVEKKMFSPMAYTIGLALIGSLVMAILVAPVLCFLFLRGKIVDREAKPFAVLKTSYRNGLERALRYPAATLTAGIGVFALSMLLMPMLGTEFLPHLDEGNLYIRATLPNTISYTEASHIVPKIREIIASCQPVDLVQSQVGRPDDGTDASGFYNAEFLVNLKPYGQWKGYPTKEALIQAINDRFSQIPGVDFEFSQNIEDNVEEAVTGVKGELAVKLFGDDLDVLEKNADRIQSVLATIPGITDLAVMTETGEPQIQIDVDRAKCARYGLNVADVQDTVQTEIGGQPFTTLLDGEKQFDVSARLTADSRNDLERIKNVMVDAPDGPRIPLSMVADIHIARGAAYVYRESGHRFIAIRFAVRGRDIGGAVADAQTKVRKSVTLPEGYYMAWGGEFESMQRAGRRFALILPITVGLIFLILFLLFGTVSRSTIVMMNVPLSLAGAIFALYLTGFHLSVSAAVGLIALFGVAVQNSVIMVSYIDHLCLRGERLYSAVLDGAATRLRPVLMTALLASIGLIPAAVSTGIGSDTQKPLAIAIIGGLVTGVLGTLFILPVLYALIARRYPATTPAEEEPTYPH